MPRAVLLLLVCGLSAADPTLSGHHGADDHAALAQAFARVHRGSDTSPAKPTESPKKAATPIESPEEEAQSTEESAVEDSPVRIFMKKVVERVKSQWRRHQLEQLKMLNPEKYEELMSGTLGLVKTPATLNETQEEVQVQNETQALDLNTPLTVVDSGTETPEMPGKLGESLTLIVQDPMNHQFKFRVGDKTKMGVLIHAIHHRLNLSPGDVNLTWNQQRFSKEDTPKSLGIKSSDVIFMDSPALQKAKKDKEAADQEALRSANLRAKEEDERLQVQLEKQRRKMVTARRAAKQQRQQRREHNIKKNNEQLVHFVDGHGRKMSMAYKRENWMGPMVGLIAKRFDLDESRVTLVLPNGQPVKPKDSMQTLRLRENDVIRVQYH